MLKYNNNNTINIFQRNYTITCRNVKKENCTTIHIQHFFTRVATPHLSPQKRGRGRVQLSGGQTVGKCRWSHGLLKGVCLRAKSSITFGGRAHVSQCG